MRAKELLFKPATTRRFNYGNPYPEAPAIDNSAAFIQNVLVKELSRSSSAEGEVWTEWYSIRIDSEGACVIEVHSHLGMSRAMATFMQLFHDCSAPQGHLFCPSCPLTIEDHPRFEHRGLNLDISRNVIYPADVRRVLDGMWMNKMNRLHLHATDSQSWPLEIPAIPELAVKGAYDDSQIWTVADVQQTQQYGEELGVEVYFEIDLPGHTASIHHAFPDLIVAYKQEPWDEYAMEPPAGQLKLKSDKARDLVSKLLNDFLPRAAKHSRHFHLGGDELNRKVYTLEEGLESSSKDVLRPLLQSFFDLCVAKVGKHALTPVFWEDVLLEWNLALPSSSVFQAWRSHDSLMRILEKGHRALFGPCQNWYLDTGMGTWVDLDPENPDTPIKYPFADWCPPFKNWRIVYAYNPFEGIYDEAHRKLIYGGEVHLWGELVDSVCLDFMLWPRAAAAAEVLWSGPGTPDESVTRRLAEMRERLVRLGIRAAMVQMEWCLRNPGCSSL